MLKAKFRIKPKIKEAIENKQKSVFDSKLNPTYVFENFIEGPANQFVKSAAIGIANRPGKSFNPLFIHGGVGRGKTPVGQGYQGIA